MKKSILSILLILLTRLMFSQTIDELPSSTIYLVRTGKFAGSAVASYIQFQNQQPFGLPVGGVVQYKIYSEGEISIAMQYSGGSMCLTSHIFYQTYEIPFKF